MYSVLSSYPIHILNTAVIFSTDTDMVMDEEIDLEALKSYSAPDILICGNCRCVRRIFSENSKH